MRPYLEKNPSQNRVGGVAQGKGPEFKPQYHTKKYDGQSECQIRHYRRMNN
jgi:hypothetical protein